MKVSIYVPTEDGCILWPIHVEASKLCIVQLVGMNLCIFELDPIVYNHFICKKHFMEVFF